MPRTITLDLPANLDAILVEKATGDDTPETLAATIIKEWCQPYADAKEAKILSQLASDQQLIDLGKRVASASPEKKAAALAAAEAALN